MGEITIDDEGYTGEQLARITTDSVRWHMEAWTAGDKKFPAKDHFEEEQALAALLANEVVFLNSHWWRKDLGEKDQSSISVNVNCNDMFAWGCADAEPLPYEQIEKLYDMWLRDRTFGAAVWCCQQRGELPQRPVAEAIRKAGIWDIDAMGLSANGYDELCRQWAAERKAKKSGDA